MIVNGSIQLGHQLATWFTSNATLVLLDGQIVYCKDGANAGKYKIGDGTTALSSLVFYGGVSSSGGGTWGSITGTLSSQTDLQNALNAKQDTITTGTTLEYFKGDLSLGTFPTNVSTFTNDAGYITSTSLTGYVPYTGATSDVDLDANMLSSYALRVTGTNGGGDIHLRHQSADPSATGQSTSLFADASGDLKWKNDNLYYTTLKTSSNTANHVYTFPDATGTVALTSDILFKSIVLASDVTNNNAVANTIEDVTGLSASFLANKTYYFKFVIWYTAAATTTGSRWGVNASAGTAANLSLISEYSLTTTTTTRNALIQSFDSPAASNATSATTGNNMAILEGYFRPTADCTFIARFASEVSSSAIVAKAGSVLYYQQLD